MRQDPRSMLRAMVSVPEATEVEVLVWWFDEARRAGQDPPMPHRDHVFRVELNQVSPTEGWYSLAGTWHGPFATPEAAERDILVQLAAWRARARELGGWAWRRTATEIVVTLPDEVEVDGGSPLTPWVRRS